MGFLFNLLGINKQVNNNNDFKGTENASGGKTVLVVPEVPRNQDTHEAHLDSFEALLHIFDFAIFFILIIGLVLAYFQIRKWKKKAKGGRSRTEPMIPMSLLQPQHEKIRDQQLYVPERVQSSAPIRGIPYM